MRKVAPLDLYAVATVDDVVYSQRTNRCACVMRPDPSATVSGDWVTPPKKENVDIIGRAAVQCPKVSVHAKDLRAFIVSGVCDKCSGSERVTCEKCKGTGRESVRCGCGHSHRCECAWCDGSKVVECDGCEYLKAQVGANVYDLRQIRAVLAELPKAKLYEIGETRFHHGAALVIKSREDFAVVMAMNAGSAPNVGIFPVEIPAVSEPVSKPKRSRKPKGRAA